MQPTPFPDVNALLTCILSGVRQVLGSQFAGMYLHGSLAAGDFDPGRSDIDFLVVTAGELSAEQLAALEQVHAGITASDLAWRTNYEGSYIPLQAIRRHDPARSVHPAVRCDGTFALDGHGSEWVIQRHVIREHGIALAGPPPADLIDPVSPDVLRRAVASLLREWWAPQVENPFRLDSSEYQAYAILTMCRALCTLDTGAVTTKPKAARWARERLDQRWSGLIERALAWRHGVELHDLAETVDLIRFTLQRTEP